ncbi:MAG: tetratricopeptide repeat protein [Candidatus Binatia bacterium]
MESDRLPRKLAAILYGDVAGYSRLMGEDEDATHRTLSEYLDLIASTIVSHRGQVMHYAGDAMLAQFTAVLDALSSAIAIQNELQTRNEALPEERKVQFRIGVNLGDVIQDRGDIYGDGVNVAARLEALVEPGGVCISDAVRTAIGNKLPFQYVFIGEHQVKNITEPVRAYRVFEHGASPITSPRPASTEVAATLKPLGKPSLAIKPFENSSGDFAQDHFADGLTSGITAALTKVPGISLIGDESPSMRESKQMTVAELGRRFDVRYVLRGGVRKYGERIRVNAELMEVSTGRYVWAERFDRELHDLADLFDIQDEITEEIVTAMDIKLLSGEAARLVRKTFTNSAALERYYRGEDLLWRATTKPELREAQRLLEEAIRLEPESPVGYATAALTYWLEVLSGHSDTPARSLERALDLASEAVERGDVTGYANLVIAHVHLDRREYDEALELANRAVSDRPSCPGAYSLKANVLNYLGRPADAIEYAEYAVRLSPVCPPSYAAVLPSAYFGCGRYEEAIAAAKATIELDERNVGLHLILAASCAALNHAEEARWAAKQLLRLKPEFSLTEFAESEPYKEQKILDHLIAQLSTAGLA